MQNEKIPEIKDFCLTPEMNALNDEIMRPAKITAICSAVILGIIITAFVICLICRRHKRKANSDLNKDTDSDNEGERKL